MTIKLTSEQQDLVRSTVENGMAESAEEFLIEALEEKRDALAFDKWVRETVVPARLAFAADRVGAVASPDVLATIKKRRRSNNSA